MEFRSAYERKEHKGLTCEPPSLTQQQFKEECDINNIIARYETTGLLTDPLHPGTRMPQFGDFSNVPDYLHAQTIIARTREAFEALPSKIRDRFDNDPAQMLEFLQDESNREEAMKLGLVDEGSAGSVRDDGTSRRNVSSGGVDLSGASVSIDSVREMGMEPEIDGDKK